MAAYPLWLVSGHVLGLSLHYRIYDGHRILGAALNPETAAVVQMERARRLLAEMRYREERETRLVLERALADVCTEMERRTTQEPAVQEALRRIEKMVAGVLAPD